MRKNDNLHRAKAAKQDEFYTQLTDIEHELKHYREHFRDKVVFCNCDDPEYSNFWQYFNLNFDFLGLRKLIATHYQISRPSYMLEMYRDERGVHTEIKTLQENGDFRSEECIALLEQADVIVTNPPFSLFREYIELLVYHSKKFLIIGNMNAITYKTVFPLIMENKIWLGHNAGGGSMMFITSLNGTQTKGIPSYWYTNLDYPQRHEDLILCKSFSPEKYPKYDNYDAINVCRVNDIPCDYYGVMGVPITFLNKYSPDQFKIVGMAAGNSRATGFNFGVPYSPHASDRGGCGVINNIRQYARILIQRKV